MALMTYAEAAVLAVAHEMEADPRVVVIGEDVGRGGIFGQYKGLQARFGAQRVIDTPISEAAIVGAGVGMALAGMRPVAEMRVVDFALCGMDEIVNQAAKNRFMFGGQGRVPLVLRMPIGIWDASAAQHSQSLESWFAHLPGLVVACPATPQDNYSLLRAALASGDPVVYMEHKTLWGMTGEVDPSLATQLGSARIVRPGQDLTVVSWSRQLQACEQACDALAAQGIAAELVDLRSIWPWDRATVLGSCARTRHLLVVHEAVQAGGFGAEIAATVAETVGCKVRRLGAPRIPVGYAPVLEAQSRIDAEDIAAAARGLLA
ncbi:alpha-ketoacid dehydrogenase subunit beta [Ramlibacter pallidus]|uniref:Alpha-ketoacid dehydrogenase subunit beta n=1 Tax=Ramlibacter pallidus TaxID=2780087 RepID=A0ABR9S8H5_9BURK|nr:transketolase C-terminal domain-containing protein [Ramlibacter pallidus]MBE7369831.1 alpha-ketoacid dehydrogenase subunit beta [Ramlibacter pallidus]